MKPAILFYFYVKSGNAVSRKHFINGSNYPTPLHPAPAESQFKLFHVEA